MKKIVTLFTLLAAAVLSAVACSSGPDLVFADWILPMPEGTPVYEYAAVPIEGRDPEAVHMLEDLVIGADLSNPEAILYQPGEIVASDDGTIFVADSGATNIKMFDADGNHVETLGQEGQGPAEFGHISQMTIAGDRLVVFDLRNRRFSLWTLQGEHVADRAPEAPELLPSVEGLSDGTVVGTTSVFAPNEGDEGPRMSIVRRSTDWEDLGTLLEIQQPTPPRIDRSNPRASLQMMIDSMADPRLSFIVAERERLFVTPVHDYQVLAMSPDGELGWALRVAWERQPRTEFYKERMIESFMRMLQSDEELKPSDLRWTAPYSAVSTMRSDGRGRLYVFPTVPQESEEPPDSRPVDVYSSEGEFLAAGRVPYVWRYARGEYVYGSRPDENDESLVVRWRLTVNGQSR